MAMHVRGIGQETRGVRVQRGREPQGVGGQRGQERQGIIVQRTAANAGNVPPIATNQGANQALNQVRGEARRNPAGAVGAASRFLDTDNVSIIDENRVAGRGQGISIIDENRPRPTDRAGGTNVQRRGIIEPEF